MEALRGVDLSIGAGEMFALLGPNGAGKTTLFSILSTLRTPTAGSARVLGRDVVTERDATRREIGIVFQEPAIERTLTVRDNLKLMGRLYGLDGAGVNKRTDELLNELNLAEAADRKAERLSGGQRRRVELARALVTNPRVLFLDEATLGLDVEARRGFWKQVRGLTSSGRSIVFATHYMEEAEVADRIAMISEGRIVALDTPQNLKSRMGGGVIRLHTADDAKAREWLVARGYQPAAQVQPIMLEQKDPAAVVPVLLRDLPVAVVRVEVHAPSLEDVFVKITGRGLADETAKNGATRAPWGGRP
ncbi:MAG TPA: ABC transporter ATP-binding protein [Opitutales bacterium]|nr:ABC transporter ATP-binding protein [Opitutales bacterium]